MVAREINHLDTNLAPPGSMTSCELWNRAGLADNADENHHPRTAPAKNPVINLRGLLDS